MRHIPRVESADSNWIHAGRAIPLDGSGFRSDDLPSDSSNTLEYPCKLPSRGPTTIVFQEFCPARSAKSFRFFSLLIDENQSIQPLLLGTRRQSNIASIQDLGSHSNG